MLDVQLVPPRPIDSLLLFTRDFSYKLRDTSKSQKPRAELECCSKVTYTEGREQENH